MDRRLRSVFTTLELQQFSNLLIGPATAGLELTLPHSGHHSSSFWTPPVQMLHQSRAVLPKPPHEPVSAKLAYLKTPPVLISASICVICGSTSGFWTFWTFPSRAVFASHQSGHSGQALCFSICVICGYTRRF